MKKYRHLLPMPSGKSLFSHLPVLVPVILLLSLLGPIDASGGSMVYKNYIVRYDRGWDILCEPYVVQKGDWVLKIFRQKGEIAHKDFRDFLGIFQRLNPQVKDTDMIRPGQTIDIPIRKLEHGALSGQASGLVTIPFVSLEKVIDVLHESMPTYRVRRGDTVSTLIAAQFGRYGSEEYEEGVKLLQAANPEITDLDLIYAGQTIHLPDPSIREKEWYAGLYDPSGAVRERITVGRSPDAGNERPAGSPSPPSTQADASQAKSQDSRLSMAAAAVGGKLVDRGTYFVPRPGTGDFEIDLSQHPLLEMQGRSLLFTRDGRIMQQPPELVQTYWPELAIVPYEEQASVEQIVGAIFDSLEESGSTGEVAEAAFEDQGVRVMVRAKWIKNESNQRRRCIMPIDDPADRTPESMRRYLEQHGIVLREILPDGRDAHAAAPQSAERHAVKDILAIAAGDQKAFVQRLARALELSYAPNVSVSFPYAGMQIKAYANLVTAPDGREVLLDFGDIYGDALASLRQSGQNVVQIDFDDSYAVIVAKVLAGLGMPFAEYPSFTAAKRSSPYNTTLSIPGFLYGGTPNERILLCGTDLHPAVTDVLSAEGVSLITW